MMKWMIWGLVLMSLVMAVGNGLSGDAKENMLQARYSQMECRAQFMYQVMENAEGFDPDASLQRERTQLQEQMQLMQQYANEGNYASFNQEMVQTRNAYTTAMQGVRNAHQNALNKAQGEGSGAGTPGGPGAGGNGSEDASQMRNRMLQQHQEAQGEYAECMRTATRSRVHAEKESFIEWHGKGKNVAAQMKERGYDTSGLEETLAEAEGVSDELESDADTAGNHEEMNEMRRNAWKKEFYLWTEFHVERFNLLLDRMDEKSDGEYTSQIEEIRALLATALELNEDQSYDAEEAAEAKQILNDAAEQMRDLLQEMSG
jgi:hypothetical protein